MFVILTEPLCSVAISRVGEGRRNLSAKLSSHYVFLLFIKQIKSLEGHCDADDMEESLDFYLEFDFLDSGQVAAVEFFFHNLFEFICRFKCEKSHLCRRSHRKVWEINPNSFLHLSPTTSP